MGKRYSKQHNQKKRKPATRADWDRMLESPELVQAWTQFARSVGVAEASAGERTKALGRPVSLDLTEAGRILARHPELVTYLDGIKEREAARLEALQRPDLALSSPTGNVRGDPNYEGMGAWAGSGFSKNNPIGIHNARQMRDYADGDEWVNAAINFLAEKVARADIAVLPLDERKPYDRATMKSMQQLLDQPNELRDKWPALIGGFTRDMLTLGQGVFTKNQTVKRRPVAFYLEDAANIKIYPAWSGDPDEPHYLYQEGSLASFTRRVPLRDDEAIVAFYNPTSYRYGQGPVQTLVQTIAADLAATRAAMHLVDFHPPPFVLNYQGASGGQILKLRSNYEQDIQGRREIMFTASPGPFQAVPLIFSAKDNQWLEWQEYLVKKISAVFQVSPQDMGLTMDINKATAQAQAEISDSKGYIPLLLTHEEYLNWGMLADFAPALPMNRRDLQRLNLRVVFPEVSEAMRMLHAEKVMTVATDSLQGLPTATLNQVLQMLGQEPVQGGNTFFVKTATGAVPWLSYDNDMGAYAPPLGTQDPAGGVNEDDDGVSPDETSDDDMGTSEDASEETTTNTDTLDSSGADGGGEAAKRYKSAGKDPDDEEEGHTGVMVAFFLNEKVARKLALPDGEPAEDLHVTLAFSGDKSNLKVNPGKLKKTLAGFASEAKPLTGKTGGIGRFSPSDSSDGLSPVIALVNVPGIQRWRADLVKRLESAGVEIAKDFEYTPHITLAYIDEDEPMPVESVPEVDLKFNEVWLVIGDERTAYPIGDEQYPQEKRYAPVKRLPAPLVRQLDTRRPGVAWSPALVRSATPRRVPASVAANYQRPHEEEQARKELQAAVKRVFGEAAERGNKKVS